MSYYDRMEYVPYVVIVLNGTKRAFALNRKYQLINEQCDVSLVNEALDEHIEKWEGWFPSLKGQFPIWAFEFTYQKPNWGYASDHFTMYRLKSWDKTYYGCYGH